MAVAYSRVEQAAEGTSINKKNACLTVQNRIRQIGQFEENKFMLVEDQPPMWF